MRPRKWKIAGLETDSNVFFDKSSAEISISKNLPVFTWKKKDFRKQAFLIKKKVKPYRLLNATGAFRKSIEICSRWSPDGMSRRLLIDMENKIIDTIFVFSRTIAFYGNHTKTVLFAAPVACDRILALLSNWSSNQHGVSDNRTIFLLNLHPRCRRSVYRRECTYILFTHCCIKWKNWKFPDFFSEKVFICCWLEVGWSNFFSVGFQKKSWIDGI